MYMYVYGMTICCIQPADIPYEIVPVRSVRTYMESSLHVRTYGDRPGIASHRIASSNKGREKAIASKGRAPCLISYRAIVTGAFHSSK